MTRNELTQIAPRAPAAMLEPLNAAMAEFEINTETREAAFIAQVAHETAELTKLVENMNYSAQGLLATFPKYFNSSEAAVYARQPEKIGNRAYANRMGNGSEESGDGFRYRGRGGLHCTGRDMYRRCGEALGLPLEEQPELLEQPEGACRSAAWIWAIEKSLNPIADREDIKLITRRINGGTNGIEERIKYWERARQVLA